MTDNDLLVVYNAAVKELLVSSFTVIKNMSNRLYQYRSSPNSDQKEADKREKELRTLQITIEETVRYIAATEQEIMRLFVLWQEEKRTSKFYYEAWQSNLNESIELTKLLIKKNKDG
ncbi:MAG: hypothetical protein OHK0045_22290 [Raineya sp.]